MIVATKREHVQGDYYLETKLVKETKDKKMADLKLNVDATMLEDLLHKGILEALSSSAQETLVQSVVKYLTTPNNSSYGPTGSPLLQALNQAARDAAFKYFAQRIEKDPVFIAEIDKLFEDALKKFFSSDTREKMVERMADRMSEAFKERY